MRIGRLVVQEIAYRKGSFALGAGAVAVAVGCAVALLLLLRQHDLATERLVENRGRQTQAMMKQVEDDLRKLSLRMGFNMMIVMQGQTLDEIYRNDAPTKFMPEDYGKKLAAAKVATINHVLPALQQKITWTEHDRPVLLTGVSGEVYIQSKEQKPLLEKVETGKMVLGSELQRRLKLNVGDKVKLMGREFTIAGVQPGRGTKEDIAAWINLGEAQEMFDKRGLINVIYALECECSNERLEAIRREVGRILPDTQVIEFSILANARAQSRQRAAEATAAAMEQERQSRLSLRNERRRLAKVLIPVVMVGCGLWIALLALGNVRDRAGEVGILRAVGWRARQVLALFLGRATLMGLVGAIVGYAAGERIGRLWLEAGTGATWTMQAQLLGFSLMCAPLLAAAASAVPALLAAANDPAELLREG